MLSAQPGGNAPAPVAYDPNEFWLRTLLRWYIGLVIRPSPTIREIVEREPLLAALVTLPVSGYLWMTLIATLAVSSLSSPTYFRAMGVMGTILVAGVLIATVTLAIFVHLSAKVAQGNGGFPGILAGTGLVAGVPSLTTAAMGFTFYVIPWGLDTHDETVYRWLALLTIPWVITLLLVVVRENYRIGIKRSVFVTTSGLVLSVPVAITLTWPLFITFILLGIALLPR